MTKSNSGGTISTGYAHSAHTRIQPRVWDSMLGGAAAAGRESTKAIESLLQDRIGSIIISILLGLGLAIIFFRRVCKGDECMVVKSPGSAVTQDRYYKLEDDCYKYVPYAVKCHHDHDHDDNGDHAGQEGRSRNKK